MRIYAIHVSPTAKHTMSYIIIISLKGKFVLYMNISKICLCDKHNYTGPLRLVLKRYIVSLTVLQVYDLRYRCGG